MQCNEFDFVYEDMEEKQCCNFFDKRKEKIIDRSNAVIKHWEVDVGTWKGEEWKILKCWEVKFEI